MNEDAVFGWFFVLMALAMVLLAGALLLLCASLLATVL